MKLSIALALIMGASTMKLNRHKPHERNYFVEGVEDTEVDKWAEDYGKDHFVQLGSNIRRNHTESSWSDHLNDLVYSDAVQLDSKVRTGRNHTESSWSDHLNDLVYSDAVQLDSKMNMRRNHTESSWSDHLNDLVYSDAVQLDSKIRTGRNHTESSWSDHLNDLVYSDA